MITLPERGDLFYADLEEANGAQYGLRPVLIIQNNVGNFHSPTTIVVPLTSKAKKMYMPTHIAIYKGILLAEQILTIRKEQLRNFICKVDDETMKKIEKAIKISIGLEDYEK